MSFYFVDKLRLRIKYTPKTGELERSIILSLSKRLELWDENVTMEIFKISQVFGCCVESILCQNPLIQDLIVKAKMTPAWFATDQMIRFDTKFSPNLPEKLMKVFEGIGFCSLNGCLKSKIILWESVSTCLRLRKIILEFPLLSWCLNLILLIFAISHVFVIISHNACKGGGW